MTRAQQHYYTGSAWIAGDAMQVPESGTTRLLSAATTSGWRVELGDPTYPIRYWDGTDTSFRVAATGQVSIYDNDLLLFSATGDTVAAVAVGPYSGIGGTSGIALGAGGAAARDTWLYRPSASTLQLNTASSFLWGVNSSSLDTGNGIVLRERTAPGTPSGNHLHLYAKDDGAGTSRLYYKDDGGTERGPL
jgi:hypothetical protein